MILRKNNFRFDLINDVNNALEMYKGDIHFRIVFLRGNKMNQKNSKKMRRNQAFGCFDRGAELVGNPRNIGLNTNNRTPLLIKHKPNTNPIPNSQPRQTLEGNAAHRLESGRGRNYIGVMELKDVIEYFKGLR